MTDKLHGILPAMVTPAAESGEPDYKTLETFVEHLIGAGVHGICPLGSTGEYYALSDRERQQVLKTTLDTAGRRVPIVAGANGGSTRAVVRYCQEAEELGAAAVLLAAPYYSLPTADELFEHFRAVDRAIGIPIVLYNYPGRTGVDMTPDLIERLAQLDSVQYVKESSGDVTRISEIIRRCGGKITVFCGCDGEALEHFLLGATGWISGAFNFLCAPCVRLFDLAVTRKDFVAARELYYELLPVLARLEAGKYTQLVKAGCALTGHPVGPPLRPLLPPGDEEVAELKALLDPIR